MTRFAGKQFTCAICGTQRFYTVLSSTETSGAPDLDTRPSGMARRDLLHAVLCCKRCKYCAPDLSERLETAPDLVPSPEYRRLLSEKGIPELARRWACWSLLQERASGHAAAGWAALRATWVCDDASTVQAADRYRAGAIESFHRAQGAGRRFAGDRVSEQLILVDLYRRTRRFERAIWLCQELQAAGAPDHIRDVVSFQLHRAEQGDNLAYTLDDAFKYAQGPEIWKPPSEELPQQHWHQRLTHLLEGSLKIPIAPKRTPSSGILSALADEG
jgi:uncharacterized protein (DUF2225 family)